jgi:hypothetical protein
MPDQQPLTENTSFSSFVTMREDLVMLHGLNALHRKSSQVSTWTEVWLQRTHSVRCLSHSNYGGDIPAGQQSPFAEGSKPESRTSRRTSLLSSETSDGSFHSAMASASVGRHESACFCLLMTIHLLTSILLCSTSFGYYSLGRQSLGDRRALSTETTYKT